MAETGTARGAHTVIHYHRNGKAAVDAATARARNTTIVIGADLDKGALLLDVDVQGEVCAGPAELRDQLLLVAETLHPEEGAPEPAPAGEAVIDAAHLTRQREWSREMFGPHQRTAGVLDHIRKELDEIEANPEDVSEWADVLILAFDGAWRAGWEPQEIIDAIHAKQTLNESRTWPDWRTVDPDKAIEHDRSGEGEV